ncbi:MAG: caspase family protein [Verrucomicrobiales bacterium]|nr:caspase family protein [Verrucomicrobiales bacterium]
MKKFPFQPGLLATPALYLCASLSPLLSQETIPSQNRLVAFVAAVSEYPGNAAMYESVANAERITQSISTLDFDVTSLLEFTKTEFEEAFRAWCKKASGAEVAIVYLCGHGGNQDGENYLFPIGTDVTSPSQLREQCIGFRSLLETLTQGQKEGQRLNLVAIDGSRENPFLSRAFGFEDASANYSAFYSLPYLPRDTIVFRPTGSGELIDRKDTSLLVEALSGYLFVDNTELRKGLESVRSLIREKSDGYLDPSLSIEFDGNLTFKKKVNGTQTVLTFPNQKSDQEALFEQLRKTSQNAVTSHDLESAIKTLLKIYDEMPEKRDVAISDLKSILTSSSMENPFTGKLLIESIEFDFARLAAETSDPKVPGLNLKEARRIFWSAGRWFPELRDKALFWAEYDAKKGVPEAMRFFGELCLKEESGEKDKLAADWFKKAADLGDIKSRVWLGQLHLMGRGVDQSFELAKKHFSDVRNAGDPRGAAGLGALELSSIQKAGLKGAKFTEALKYFREAYDGKFYKVSSKHAAVLLMESEAPGISAVRAAEIRREAVEILLTGAEKGVDSRCMWILFKLIKSKKLDGDKELLASIPEEKQTELLKQAADLGYPEAVKEAQINGIDYLNSAKPLCEKWNLIYELWKMDQKRTYTLLDNK